MALSAPEISSIECIGLAWKSKEFDYTTGVLST